MTDRVLEFAGIYTMTDDHIIDYIITDEEFEALTADQRETLRGDFGLIRCPDGSYYTIGGEKEMVRVR